MKNLLLLFLIFLLNTNLHSQIIVLDPGHGYGATTSDNPDGRTATEIETALAVGLKTKNLIENSCTTWTVHMTRTTNLNSWISVMQRAQMSNNWDADRILSIHCNAGGGTGTETFYCTHDDPTTAPDIFLAQNIQSNMVTNGSFFNRRCVEDNSYLNYHLGVLRYSTATGCLNEIGFVDNVNDSAKLNSNSWRDAFALSYFNSLKTSLNLNCNTTSSPGNFTLTATPQCNGSTSGISLNWTTSANATSYDIYRNNSLYATDVTGNSFLNTYLINGGTSYSYFMKAKNTSTNQTINSNGTQTVVALDCSTPGDFTLTATPECNGSTSGISLNWTPSTNATSYDIYRNNNLYASDVTGTYFLNTYLINGGTSYSYFIKAKNTSTNQTNNSNGTQSVVALNCTLNNETFNQNTSFTIWPNPTTDLINIKTNNTTSKIIYTIIDISGQIIKESYFIEEKTINISELSAGIYYIKFDLDGNKFVKEIIKK